MKRTLALLLSAITLLGVESCKRDFGLKDQSVQLSAPIAGTSLSLKDFIESENYEVDNEGKVHLRYGVELYTARPIEYLSIPNRTDSHKVSLETISLSNTAIESDVTLGEAYSPAILLHGKSVAIDTITIFNASTIQIDANTFFESASLESGWMIMTIKNGFPVDIESMLFRLRNASDNSLVGEPLEFKDIKAGETKTDSVDMTGEYAEGNMIGELVRVKTRASDGEVLINKNDALTVTVRVKDLKAFEATAVFPAQDLIDFDLAWDYDFGGAELTDLIIESGTLVMQVQSSINEIVRVTYEAPALVDPTTGDTVLQKFDVPAAVDGKGITEREERSLAGYQVILRGKRGEGWLEKNAFHNRLKASIDYTGVKKTISKRDSITLYIGVIDVVPSFARGYLGQELQTIGPETKSLDAFNNLSGVLELDDLEMSLEITNTAGVDALVAIPSVTSINKEGKEVAFESDLLSGGITVGAGTETGPAWRGVYQFNQSNSNADAFVENLPKAFNYSLVLSTNPAGNDNDWQDFIKTESELTASVMLDIPMNLDPKSIVLQDTINIGLTQLASNLENADEMNLNMIVYNGYPYFSSFKLILLDENDESFKTLYDSERVAEPGVIADGGDKVTEVTRTIFTETLTRSEIDQAIESKRAIVIATLQSSTSVAYPIYDSYTIDIKLTADVAYNQGFE